MEDRSHLTHSVFGPGAHLTHVNRLAAAQPNVYCDFNCRILRVGRSIKNANEVARMELGHMCVPISYLFCSPQYHNIFI